ncbi:MAG TPA: hypothetical protein PKW44_05310 [Methylophilaceae bacterium]|nr:hypothetical protein [Methylophilaceae bacterium]
MRNFLILLLGFSCAPLLSAEGNELIIPETPEQMEQTMGDDDPCDNCGVVTDVRHRNREVGPDPSLEKPGTLTIAEVTPDGVALEHIATHEESTGPWLVTVRYGDEFIVHEQNMRPAVEIGDRVQLVEGKIVPR